MSEQGAHRIWSTILAAGISSRMGKPKLSLPWGEHTILEETTQQVMDAGYDGVVVVLGDPNDALEPLLAGRAVKVARNLNYRAGMCTSIKAGVAFIDVPMVFFAQWVSLPVHDLERIERLEQLRPMAAGMAMGVHLVDAPPLGGVDTEEDLVRANALWDDLFAGKP